MKFPIKALQTISSILAKWTSLFVIAAAVFSYFEPRAFLWVKGDAQTALLGVIMLAMGMTLKKEDFKILAARPFDIAIGTIAQFTIMPLGAYMIVHFFGLPKAIGIGLILVGCSPGGVSSNIMSYLCKGDVAFSVGMTTLSTLLAPFATPLLMLWLASESVDVEAVAMFKSILIVTLLPVALGFALNTLFAKKSAYGEILKLMPAVAVLGLAAIVGGVVAHHGKAFIHSGALVFAAVFCHNSLGYALGYACGALARFSGAKRRTISIEVGMQNAGLATVLAQKHFPALPEAALASAVSCAWHSISGALVAGLFNLLPSRRISAHTASRRFWRFRD